MGARGSDLWLCYNDEYIEGGILLNFGLRPLFYLLTPLFDSCGRSLG